MILATLHRFDKTSISRRPSVGKFQKKYIKNQRPRKPLTSPPLPAGPNVRKVGMFVSRFFCFPIQMNFAEIPKWRTKPMWRGPHATRPAGLVRRVTLPGRLVQLPCSAQRYGRRSPRQSLVSFVPYFIRQRCVPSWTASSSSGLGSDWS